MEASRTDPLDDLARALVVFEEYLARRRRGEAEAPSELLERFADLRPILEPMLQEAAGELEAEPGAADGAEGWIGRPESNQDFGPFSIVEQLGEGGMASVFCAEHRVLGRRVALKLIRPERLFAAVARERFWREAKAASRLDHPNICPVYEVGEVDGVPFMAMRLIEGETLAQRLQSWRRSRSDGIGTPTETRSELTALLLIFEKVARALHYAHESGVVHRDVKPGNIMVATDGEPFVLDFGIARDEESEAGGLTATGDLTGTPLYMSPEQVEPRGRSLDRRTDVYSLGVTLYECLTLDPAFHQATPRAMYDAILRSNPVPARRRNRQVPRDLDVVLEKALDKERERRYRTALDFAEDLRRVREREPVRAVRAGAVLRARRWVQREPLRASLLVAMVLVTALVGYLAARWPELRAAAEQSRRERAERRIEEGFLLLSERHLARSESAFREALEIEEETPLAAAGLAMTLWKQNRAAEALEDIAARADLERRYPELALIRAHLLRLTGSDAEAEALEARLGQPEGELGLFLTALRENPREGVEAARRGLALLRECALSTPVARPIYHFEMSEMVTGADDPSAGRAIAASIQRLWPESGAAWFASGNALREYDTAAAAAAFEHATQLWPEFAPAWNNLAVMRRAEGDADGALAAAHEAVRLAPKLAEAHATLGLALIATGEWHGSIPALREAVRLSPDGHAHHFHLGRALHKTWDLEGARAAFEAAVRLDDEHALSHYSLGNVLRWQGDFAGAIEAYRRAEELAAGDPDWELPSMVGTCEQLIAVDGVVRDKLRDAESLDPAERAALARGALGISRYLTAARLWRSAVAEAPELADQVTEGYQYLAASAAVLASWGLGSEPVPEADRPIWRRRALDWLEADLAAWRRAAERSPRARGPGERRLRLWRASQLLDGIRDPVLVSTLPREDRERCAALWAEVEDQIATWSR